MTQGYSQNTILKQCFQGKEGHDLTRGAETKRREKMILKMEC